MTVMSLIRAEIDSMGWWTQSRPGIS